ncbi:18 kDa seed maturation protein, partial [Mucuna pruriens]
MQAAKIAVENIKETAANIGASAKSGLEKTKATIQEKNEIMNAQTQSEKNMATRKKEEKINQAEMEKLRARENNAAAKQSALASQMTQAHYANTGPETESTTIDIPGPRTATNNTTWPESVTTVYPNTGPETQTAIYNTTGPTLDNAVHSNTGTWVGHETATYPTGDYGQMGANQTTSMPEHHGLGHGHGPGHGGFTEDAVGSRPNETNIGVDTMAQTTLSGPNFS